MTLIVLGLFIFIIFGMVLLLEKLFPKKSYYEDWLVEKLRIEPNYIEWLKHFGNKNDYQLGKRILKKIRRKQ